MGFFLFLMIGLPLLVIWALTLLALLLVKLFARRPIDGPTFRRQAVFAVPIAVILFVVLAFALLRNAQL